MTLGEFFEVVGNNPSIILFYFIAVPLTALLAWIFGRKEGHISPWKYLYTTLIYMALVPGIFAVTLSAYMLLIERQSIQNIDLFTQIIPIISMALTLFLIKQNTSIRDIPGFGKLSGLMLIITVVLILLMILNHTHIFAITTFPFYYVIIFLIILFVVIRIGIKKISG